MHLLSVSSKDPSGSHEATSAPAGHDSRRAPTAKLATAPDGGLAGAQRGNVTTRVGADDVCPALSVTISVATSLRARVQMLPLSCPVP